MHNNTSNQQGGGAPSPPPSATLPSPRQQQHPKQPAHPQHRQSVSSSTNTTLGSYYHHYYSSFRRKASGQERPPPAHQHEPPRQHAASPSPTPFPASPISPAAYNTLRRSSNSTNGGVIGRTRFGGLLRSFDAAMRNRSHYYSSTSSGSHSKSYYRPARPSSSKSATFWIGMLMFLLAVVYVLVVVLVARFHLVHLQPTTTTTSSMASAGGSGSGKISPANAHVAHENNLRNKAELMKQSNDKGSSSRASQHPLVLTAFVEPLQLEEWDVKPLPIRSTAQQSLLRKIEYPQLTSCSKLPEQWPVNDGSVDSTDGSITIGNPVDLDPFLPWIHDVFPTEDGRYVQFVAQNKRRCRTGVRERHIMDHMQPQVALFQHVSVQRIVVNETSVTTDPTRYKVVPYEQADPDGITTRFICRFKQHAGGGSSSLPQPQHLETLAIHNFDYDWTGFRKRYKAAFLKDDGGIKSIHTTQLLFRCPIPNEWHASVRNGSTVINDYATLFVDVIPIRTPPRYGITNRYLAPWFAEFNSQNEADKFDPMLEYGDNHVLPLIEDSGRWENIPICLPSLMAYENVTATDLPPVSSTEPSPYDSVRDSTAMASIPLSSPVKKHRLVSCIWASAGYATRGERFSINDGQRRLMEWLHHNINIGFDHFYLYDNSAAFDSSNNLKGIADLFPDHVTYINWPSKVCNNRPNNVDSPGERSSQYAAESSCRLRFGPHVEWIGQFDIDEYLIPMGEHKSALSLLDKLDKEDTRIVSFGSWRAWPRFALIEEPVPITSQKECWHTEPCFDLRIPLATTMLQAYNCDRQPPGQKKVQMPAEKQLYRAAYVTQHFVHYSASTILSALNRTEFSKAGFDWWRRPFPDPRQRFANELNEGLMIHSKAVAHQDTAGWKTYCSVDSLKLDPKDRGMCRLGVPFPTPPTANNYTEDGWMYNCYVNPKVEELYVPMLEKALKPHLSYFDGAGGIVAPKT